MERYSIGAYVEDFLAHGSECAYVQRRGYRTERWSYRKIAEGALQVARDLDAKVIRLLTEATASA